MSCLGVGGLAVALARGEVFARRVQLAGAPARLSGRGRDPSGSLGLLLSFAFMAQMPGAGEH